MDLAALIRDWVIPCSNNCGAGLRIFFGFILRLLSLLFWPGGWLILTRLYVITASVILVIYAVVNHGDMAGRAAPAPAPGPDAPAPSPAASHDAAAAFVTMFLSAKPGLQSPPQLYALLVAAGVMLYNLLDRVKVWDKFWSAGPLFEGVSKPICILLMVLMEVGFTALNLTLMKVFWPETPFWAIFILMYAILQIVKATAEALKMHVREQVDMRMIWICAVMIHAYLICAVWLMYILPYTPVVMCIGISFQVWANAAMAYIAAGILQEQPAQQVPQGAAEVAEQPEGGGVHQP